MSSRPILVTGANGHLGRRLCLRLAGERPVRALVRSERAAAQLRALPASARPEIAIVDYGNVHELTREATGCEAALHLVGILKETRRNRYADAHEEACRALAEAADTAGLRRVVTLSILGADTASANECLASRARAEQILLAAKTPAVVIRVPMVLGTGDSASDALRRQAQGPRARLVAGGACLEQPIAARDVVEALLAALSREGLERAVLELAGPESLTHRALVERAAALLGARVEIGSIPAPVARAFAWIAERAIADPPLTRAMLGVLERDDHIDPEPARARLGIPLTALDVALREALLVMPRASKVVQ